MFAASSEEKLCISLNIGNTVLQQVEFSKYLGVYIDSDLSWQHHVDFIYNKIIKYTSIFYKIRNILNFDILKMIYFCFCILAFGLWHRNLCKHLYEVHK